MKLLADRKRTGCHFTVGDQVLLKLQPYTQSTVANHPFPKLAYKYFGPYTVLERVGSVAYKLDLLEGHMIHPVFHISQLKPFVPDCTPVFETLPVTTDLAAAAAVPDKIIDRRLVKKGNTTIPQVKVIWTGLHPSTATWEDYHVLRHHFPDAPAWGQASSSAGGSVTGDTVGHKTSSL